MSVRPYAPLNAFRNQKITRRAALGAAAVGSVAATAGLAGCSTTPESAPTAAAPSLVEPSSQVELSLWTWAWPAEPDGAALKKAFEKAVPEVKLSVKKDTFRDYLTALRTGVPNKTSGDVLHMQTGSMLRRAAVPPYWPDRPVPTHQVR